jgi:hypothetical protein
MCWVTLVSRNCRKKDLFATLGFSVTIKKVCVRDVSKQRDFELPAGAVIVTDPKEVVNDDSIQARWM